MLFSLSFHCFHCCFVVIVHRQVTHVMHIIACNSFIVILTCSVFLLLFLTILFCKLTTYHVSRHGSTCGKYTFNFRVSYLAVLIAIYRPVLHIHRCRSHPSLSQQFSSSTFTTTGNTGNEISSSQTDHRSATASAQSISHPGVTRESSEQVPSLAPVYESSQHSLSLA